MKQMGLQDLTEMISFWKNAPDQQFKVSGMAMLYNMGLKPYQMASFWNQAPDDDFKNWGIEYMHSL